MAIIVLEIIIWEIQSKASDENVYNFQMFLMECEYVQLPFTFQNNVPKQPVNYRTLRVTNYMRFHQQDPGS